MKIVITAGPTREYIDTVRFITNASSGKMGIACATAAIRAGHKVTLLLGPVCISPPAGCEVIPFTTVDELKMRLSEQFDNCDALIMSAAVGDFTVKDQFPYKISRSTESVQITLVPTEDILANIANRKKSGQIIIGFSLEDVLDEKIGRQKLREKNCDYLVINTTSAIGKDESESCIISPQGIILPPARRSKDQLANEIISLLAQHDAEKAR